MIELERIKQNIEMLSKEKSLAIDSIFIEQNGKIDCFFYQKESLHELRSCSKCLVGLAIGIAIDRKMLTLDTLIYPAIKNVVQIRNKNNLEKIKQWTIRNCLMHTTGYEEQMMSERYTENIVKEQLIDYALNYDMPYKVGERFAYNNVEPFILSVFFQESFKVNLTEFIQENIFSPLGITEYKWDNYGKYCPGATGLYLKHSDFHKIGQLLLNDGQYNHQQIVSKNWIKEMCRMQRKTPEICKKERVLPKYGVGYFTFISRDGYVFRDGSNGQYIILNKEKNHLITIMSSEKEMKNVTEILRNII